MRRLFSFASMAVVVAIIGTLASSAAACPADSALTLSGTCTAPTAATPQANASAPVAPPTPQAVRFDYGGIAVPAPTPFQPTARTFTTTQTVEGRSNLVLDGVTISTTSGPCLTILNSTMIEVRNSQIGPCGGNAVEVFSSNHVLIVDSYIHPERAGNGCNPCDRGDGIFSRLSSQVRIQGNVIAYGESNVELLGVTESVVRGNFLLNPLGPHPRGQQVQVWAYGNVLSRNNLIDGNYTVNSLSSAYAMPGGQWDAINVGWSENTVVSGNYIVGGYSSSGCGLTADHAANGTRFANNTLVDTGQCGIGIGSGLNQVVDGNRVFNRGLNLPNAGNTAVYVWQQYAEPCGPVMVSNNTAVLVRPNGQLSSYWKGPGCDPTTLQDNVWDQAAIAALSPIETRFPAPAVPPAPFRMVATSPWSGARPIH